MLIYTAERLVNAYRVEIQVPLKWVDKKSGIANLGPWVFEEFNIVAFIWTRY